MATDPRAYWITAYTVRGSIVTETYDTEDAAIAEYRKPLAGWRYDHAFLVSGSQDGGMQAEPIDLPGMAREAEREQMEDGWEDDANRYARGGGYR